MKRIISAITGSILLVWSSFAQAEIQFGFGLMTGNLSTDGTETEGTAADTSTSSGLTIGLSYVPLDLDIGEGKRTDSAVATASGGAENDTGDRSASAEVSDLFTLYTNVPMGTDGWYALGGVHFATIETTESLPNSSYGNEDIYGYQIGLGRRVENAKVELSYSDFEDIDITASGGNSNSVSAEADSLQFRVSFGF